MLVEFIIIIIMIIICFILYSLMDNKYTNTSQAFKNSLLRGSQWASCQKIGTKSMINIRGVKLSPWQRPKSNPGICKQHQTTSKFFFLKKQSFMSSSKKLWVLKDSNSRVSVKTTSSATIVFWCNRPACNMVILWVVHFPPVFSSLCLTF